MSVLSLPEPRKREFLPKEFKVTVWSRLKPYFNELLGRPIDAVSTLEKWIFDWNELNALIHEEINWRYIRFTTNTLDERAEEAYHYAIQEILPKAKIMDQQLRVKLFDSGYSKKLNRGRFGIFLRDLQNRLELYNEENTSILSVLKNRAKEYGSAISRIKVKIGDRGYNFQGAGQFLESENRTVRREAFEAIHGSLEKESARLDYLFDELLGLRQQVALNAGFDHYRDYKFKALGRFDYTPNDCMQFHKRVKDEVLPVLEKLYRIRKKTLDVEDLRPWDIKADLFGYKPLHPFDDTDDLILKTIKSLERIDPFFGNCLAVMKNTGHLDLNARKAKRPGGYNMSLPLSGIPFIFMNATGTTKDIAVLAHESGHAAHSFLMKDFLLNSAKQPPSEVSELAAMTMELLVMENLDAFFSSAQDIKRVRLQHYERILYSLCWIACVDKFQHWVYTHPEHNRSERAEQWLKVLFEFIPSSLNFDGLESIAVLQWKKQLHIFELPFYYIEYGFAQLGAIALWKQYLENPSKTIGNFKKALKLGYTRPVPEIYETAGIRFDFSHAYIKALITEVEKAIDSCFPDKA